MPALTLPALTTPDKPPMSTPAPAPAPTAPAIMSPARTAMPARAVASPVRAVASPARTSLVRARTHVRVGARSHSVSSLPLPRRLPVSMSAPGMPATAACLPAPAPAPTPRRPSERVAGAFTPSRLPSTETVSYFPPFETMGSAVEDDAERARDADDASAESSTAARRHGARAARGTGSGRSLGSLGALVSWATFFGPPDTECTGADASGRAHATHARAGSSGGAAAVEALTRRLQSRRRVLEPIPVNAQDLAARRRRMRSEDEVDRLVPACAGAEAGSDDEDEGRVERLVDAPRRDRPHLRLALPTLPWRFPITSPPVTSLSPDISLAAFHKVDNPATPGPASPVSPASARSTRSMRAVRRSPRSRGSSASPSTLAASPVRSAPSAARALLAPPPGRADDVDLVDDGLLAASPPTPPAPRTPQRAYAGPGMIDVADKAGGAGHDEHGLRLGAELELKRSLSRVSCDSKETVRPGAFEVTPKAARWRVAA